MKTELTPEILLSLKNQYNVIVSQVEHRAKHYGQTDNEPWLAYEIIDLIDWIVDPIFQRNMAKKILSKLDLGSECKGYIRKYFGVY